MSDYYKKYSLSDLELGFSKNETGTSAFLSTKPGDYRDFITILDKSDLNRLHEILNMELKND